MKHCPTCDCETQLMILSEQQKCYQDTIASASAKLIILEAEISTLERGESPPSPPSRLCSD